MSIQDIWNKIKGVHQDSPNILPISVIIALVGIGSFFLGRISNNNTTKYENVKIITNMDTSKARSSINTQNVTNLAVNGNYVASKNGKLYYTVGCSGASRLSEKNKIYFNTEQEAIDEGYILAAACNN